MKFKVGDRVRIDCPDSPLYRREGVIWKILPEGDWSAWARSKGVCGPSHRVAVDGYGKLWVGTGTPRDGSYVAYRAHKLKPIQPLGSWDEITRMVGKDIRDPVPA